MGRNRYGAGIDVRLYTLAPSHPSRSVQLMLEEKVIEHEVVRFEPGFQPLQLRLHGFRGSTVPALDYGGRRVQGSTHISRFLDSVVPEPPLFGTDPKRRAAIEEAERWGEAAYQPLPRRLFRFSLCHDQAMRRQLAEESGLPLPELTSRISQPMAAYFARLVDADEAHVRADVGELPVYLDHVDALIEEGTLGGEEPNAADFQIAPTTRVMLNFPQLRDLIEERPAGAHAMRLCADFGGEVPARVPQEWLPA